MHLLNITYTDEHGQPQHVVVTQPHGTGGGYHVYVNDYFRGQIVYTSHGWTPYITWTGFTADDIDAIMDAVNKREGQP